MTWNFDNRIAGAVRTILPVWRNIFYQGETISWTLEVTGGGSPAATMYEVRNFYGQIVSSGAVTGTTLTLPSNLPLGWYKVYFIRPSSVGAPWYNSGGESTFCVIKQSSNFVARPALGTSRATDPQTQGIDFPTRGMIRMGPHRLSMFWGAEFAGNLAGAVSDAAYQRQWTPNDPVRPLFEYANFQNDPGNPPTAQNLADTATAVNQLTAAGVYNFEGMNEPNVVPITVANTIIRYSGFADAVHNANASAKVMGPCSVNIGSQINWMMDVLTGLGNKIDVISYHNYDGGYSIATQRKVFDNLEVRLAAVGMANKPRVNTEGLSAFMAVYGSFEPMLQARKSMLELAISEQYKTPKENMSVFYDLSHGFWSFPSFWIFNESGEPYNGPLINLIRTWSDELYGKAYAARLDFGTVENEFYVGSRFDNPNNGTKVISIISDGLVSTIKLQVTGGATALEIVDCWGNVTLTPVVGGLIDMPATYLPTYLRLPAGIGAAPVAVNYGQEVARAQVSLPTASSVDGTNYPTKALNGDQITSWFAATTDNGPSWYQIDFPTTTRFDRVVVSCPFPWQQDSALLDFDIQVWTGFSWVTLATDQETVTVVPWSSHKALGACWVDTYYSRRNVFKFEFSGIISTTKLRVYARNFTYGGGPTVESTDGAGRGGGATGQTGPKRMVLTEVKVYLKQNKGSGVGQNDQALPGIGVSL